RRTGASRSGFTKHAPKAATRSRPSLSLLRNLPRSAFEGGHGGHDATPCPPCPPEHPKNLPAQVHTPLPVHLPKERILQILDEVDRFTRALHLRSEALVHVGEFLEAEDGHLDG